jgi:hypothetical protein
VVPVQRPAHPSSMVRRGVQMLAAGLCLVAAVAIWALVTGSFDDTSVRVLLTGLAAALCTLGGLAGSTALRLEGSHRRVGELTVVLSHLTLVIVLAVIWVPGATGSDALVRAWGVTSALVLAGAHASLLLARSRRLDTRMVHVLTQAAIACATSSALLISGVVTASDGPVAPAVWRLLGVLVVLAVLNTLLIPLARRVARNSRPPGADATSATRRTSTP